MSEEKSLQIYRDSAVQEMALRIKTCVPNGQRLKENEALALAQIALTTGLSPFTGEIWYIPGKGPMVGIAGLRSRAQAKSSYTLDFRAMRDEEITGHNIKPDDMGRICALFRHDTLAKAVAINQAAGKEVVPVQPVLGLGIWRKGDQVPAGKSPTWVADKRAEADALRKAFDLTVAYSDEVNDLEVDIGNGQPWHVVDDEEEEALRREAAHNAERHTTPALPPVNVEALRRAYAAGEREWPTWARDLREQIERDPKAGDSLKPDLVTSIVGQLRHSSAVSADQFNAFIQVALGHRPESITFGEARVLKDFFDNQDGTMSQKIEALLA